MKSFKEFMLLNEMIKIGFEKDDSYVIAFNKWIYILDPTEDNKNKLLDILKFFINTIPEFETNFNEYYEIFKKEYGNKLTIELVFGAIRNFVRDAFIGIISDDILIVQNYIANDPEGSRLMMKVDDELELKGIKIIKDKFEYELIKKNNIKNTLPTIGFHGSSSEDIENILRIGLRPQHTSSWGLDAKGCIFFSTRMTQPIYHANRKYTLSNYKYLPIVYEFIIPDSDKLMPDFDMERLTGKHNFFDLPELMKEPTRLTMNTNALKLSREFGIYGYRGNINPKHITHVWIPNDISVLLSKNSYKKKIESLDSFIRIPSKDALTYITKFAL